MSWSGEFKIKYKGWHPKEFHKLAKMIIPNSILRFDFDNCIINENSVVLECTRDLYWYSADKDMKRLLSYLPDGDSISMKIDADEYEEIEITKNDGIINFKNTNPNTVRYKSEYDGIYDAIIIGKKFGLFSKPEKPDITSLDGYIQFISNIFADDEQLIPIVQDFMSKILLEWFNDLKDLKESADLDDIESYNKLIDLINKFSTIESTKQFLKEHKNDNLEYKSAKKQSINDLPEWAKKYPRSVIESLGGASTLKQIIESKGEGQSRSIIELLASGIMSERGMDKEEYDENQSLVGIKR